MKYVGILLQSTMQSWGGASTPNPNDGASRGTEMFPTKSGVLGLIRSAMGIERGLPDVVDLPGTRMLIRSDNSGKLMRDYQVVRRAHHGYSPGSGRQTLSNKQIPKDYLVDAAFLVLVGHEDEHVVKAIAEALQNPKWALFYGRKACVPALPVYLGVLSTETPRSVLKEMPILWGNPRHRSYVTSRDVIIRDTDTTDTEGVSIQQNEPIRYSLKRKQFSENYFGYIHHTYTRDANLGNILEQYLAIKNHFGA